MAVACLLAVSWWLVAVGCMAETKGPDADSVSSAPAQAASAEEGDDETTTVKKAPLDVEWMPFPDKSKFKVSGLYWFDENSPKLLRMPVGQLKSLPGGVRRRCTVPAGGRILIKCNTTKMGLKVIPHNKGSLKGFDVYIDGKFYRSVVAEEPGIETELVLFRDLDNREKEIEVYLPCHQEVLIRSVGVDKGTSFSAPVYRYAKPLPVVFYGSSVCNGNGATKPGMTYEAKLCRDLNLDFVNLGFGGAGKAEKVVVDLVTTVPACCYVFDLGKSYGMQDKTAYLNMLKNIRAGHPGVPIICITPITSALEVHSKSYADKSVHTRTVMREAVKEALAAGDRNLYLVEGPDLLGFDDHDGLSKDGVHPSDYGYGIIAERLKPTVKKALGM